MKGLVIRPLTRTILGGSMKKNIEQYFRVECNFGCKYFTNPEKAKAYFDRKANKHLDVEMWLVTYCSCEKKRVFSATQDLLAYSGTTMPKC